MALRKRLADKGAAYPDPILGVNLHAAEQDLQPGEARLLENCYYDAGVSNRPGTTRLTPLALASYNILGGHKYYYGTSSSKRLVAYNNTIAAVDDAGAQNILNSGMTAGKDTYFTTWSVTDKVYITNGADTLREYDGTTFQATNTIGGAVAVPTAVMVKPILDRLMCVTASGVIERSNPRVAHIWSNNSSWATFRPQLGGPFTAIHPHTLRSTRGDLIPGLLATQANALYMVSGDEFGADVTAASPPSNLSAKIQLIDPLVGTSSPDSLCTVPGVGTFGFSSDLNIWLLPFGEASIRFVGDKLRSTTETMGIESANVSALKNVWMRYFDRKLWVGFPTGTDTFCSRYFWLDIRALMQYPERGFVWHGPHTGFYVNRAWVENQFGDNALKGGEGNIANAGYVYNLHQSGTVTDAVGSSDVYYTMNYQTYFNPFGGASVEKYVQGVQLDASCFTGEPTVSLHDLNATLVSGVTLTAI